MKKLISALAAFAVICGSFAGVSLPSVSVSSVDATGVGATEVYDYEGSDKKTDTIERNGMVFDIYENASEGRLKFSRAVGEITPCLTLVR